MGWWTGHVVPRLADASLRGRAIGESRALACAGLSGRVLELGFGGGLNLVHLPAEVESSRSWSPRTPAGGSRRDGGPGAGCRSS